MSFKSILAPIYLCLIRREIVVPQGDVDIKRCPSQNNTNCDFCVSCGPATHAWLYSPGTTATCRKGFPQSPPRFTLRRTLKHAQASLQGAGHGPAGAARSRESGCGHDNTAQSGRAAALGMSVALLPHSQKKQSIKKAAAARLTAFRQRASPVQTRAQSHSSH